MVIDFFSKIENICLNNSVSHKNKHNQSYNYDVRSISNSTPIYKSELYHKQTVGLITLKNVSIV